MRRSYREGTVTVNSLVFAKISSVCICQVKKQKEKEKKRCPNVPSVPSNAENDIYHPNLSERHLRIPGAPLPPSWEMLFQALVARHHYFN